MNKPAFLLAVTVSLTLTACSPILNNLPGVYKLDIEQGNMIDQGMIDQLRPNMTKRQVLYIMGSPMLADSFHEKRWDYLYSKEPSGEARLQKRVSLFFNGDNLIGVQGDFRPSAVPVIKESTENSIELPKRDLEKSMWEKVSGLFGDEPNAVAQPVNTGKQASGSGAGKEPAAPVSKEPAETAIEPPKHDAEKSLWDSFTGLFGGEPDTSTQQTNTDKQSSGDGINKDSATEKNEQ